MSRDPFAQSPDDGAEQLDFGVAGGSGGPGGARREEGSGETTAGDSREKLVRPLADRIRPRGLEEMVGQEHLTAEGAPFRRFLESGRIPSLILWGPPGSGKTTLARILASTPGHAWEPFSAVTSGVKEVRAAIERARARVRANGTRTLLFVDEIHRFNRAQQDAFLPHVEAGTIVLIGATTENPSFHVNAALLSRCRVYVLNPLSDEALRSLGERALAEREHDPLEVTAEGWTALMSHAQGDARRLISAFEVLLAHWSGPVDHEAVRSLLQTRVPRRLGDEDHFDWISALQKSIRGSDPHAAVYWVARLLAAGEDPLYLARRLVRTASEDIGLADPGALGLANAAREAVEFLGLPEAEAALAECAIYLALAPKSNSAAAALGNARDEIERSGPLPVPLRLRNATTRLLREQGYGEGYRYAHAFPGHWVPESYLPDLLAGRNLYEPSRQGREGRMIDDHAARTRDYYGLRAGAEELDPGEASK